MTDPADLRGDVVVLVEGRSDAAVVRRLAGSRGLGVGLDVVDMGGVTNTRHWLGVLRAQDADRPVLGLCDAPEQRVVMAALTGHGRPASDLDELARLGFFVCVSDLEDELIRAVGTGGVERALADLGDLDRFRTFQRQPEWRGRPLHAQLRRFAGAGSGRKLALADRLAQSLEPDAVPLPLVRLLDRVASVHP